MLAHRDPLDANFAALADPTRRAILARLAQGHMHLDDLAQPFGISAFRHFGISAFRHFGISGPTVSHQLRVLQQAGLIEREVDAR